MIPFKRVNSLNKKTTGATIIPNQNQSPDQVPVRMTLMNIWNKKCKLNLKEKLWIIFTKLTRDWTIPSATKPLQKWDPLKSFLRPSNPTQNGKCLHKSPSMNSETPSNAFKRKAQSDLGKVKMLPEDKRRRTKKNKSKKFPQTGRATRKKSSRIT